jgi:hypothetical protein
MQTREMYFGKNKPMILGEFGKGYGGSRWSVMGHFKGQIADFNTRAESVKFARKVVRLGWKKAHKELCEEVEKEFLKEVK